MWPIPLSRWKSLYPAEQLTVVMYLIEIMIRRIFDGKLSETHQHTHTISMQNLVAFSEMRQHNAKWYDICFFQ